ncbi:Protein OS-9-like [Vitis vinifera]|uniref:Protein OS-9-like n=1 Tax=Vitis vinifera TaxID=29760 RepID=A0A438J8G5_VITVI|nr:Protein OS-9-like [Vitis vinifera]
MLFNRRHPPLRDDDQESVIMPNKNGQKFLCFLPKVEKAKTGKPVTQQNTSSMIVETEKRVKLKTPDELLEVIKERCFVRLGKQDIMLCTLGIFLELWDDGSGKYGQQEGGWCSKEAREGHGVRLWKTIKSVCKALKEKIGFKRSMMGSQEGVFGREVEVFLPGLEARTLPFPAAFSGVEGWIGPMKPAKGTFVDVAKLKGVEACSREETNSRELQRRVEQLGQCLVGWCAEVSDPTPNLSSLKRWVMFHWALKGGVKIAELGGALLLFEFGSKIEAKRALARGLRRLGEKAVKLERWSPKAGCFPKGMHAKEVWVRIVGLPLHLWSREIFKKFGYCCGGFGFVAVDDYTTYFSQLQWARVLVKRDGRDLLSSLQVVLMIGNGRNTIPEAMEDDMSNPGGRRKGKAAAAAGSPAIGTAFGAGRDSPVVVQEFILGVYDAEATAAFNQNLSDISTQKDPRSKDASQRYHAHQFTNGTICDLTNEPRETEVRFVCSEPRAMISSITELSTCKYALTFQSPMLCKHPWFQEERPVWHIINCNALPKDYKETKAEEAPFKNKQITMATDVEYPSNHGSEQ